MPAIFLPYSMNEGGRTISAKRIAPDGQIEDLSNEEYLTILLMRQAKLPTLSERMSALFEIIEMMKTLGDEEWSDAFNQRLNATFQS